VPLPFVAYVLGAIGVYGAATAIKALGKNRYAKKTISAANKLVKEAESLITKDKKYGT